VGGGAARRWSVVTLVLLVCAGAAGALTRFVVDGVWRARWPGRFPWPTVAINVTGAFVLGALTGLAQLPGGSSLVLQTVLGTGFCGGYTTFSTASFESVRLFQQGRWRPALANTIGTLVLTVAAAAAGLGVIHLIT